MKKTPLSHVHEALGARMVEFGGWSMPVQYGSILEEGRAVRSACGLFDLGHMGRFHVTGPDAVALCDRVSSNHVAKVPVGGIRYSLLLNEEGYPLDDFLFYVEEAGVYLVVNASNTEQDLVWIRRHATGLEVELDDQTGRTGMLALQGPLSQDILSAVTDADLAGLKYYRFTFGTLCGLADVRISRTGYTGEDGFELYLPNEETERVWHELMRVGGPHGLRPIGLGARDVLRLEAGMALYGHELDLCTDPLEAGVDFALSFSAEKGDYVGRRALEARRGRTRNRLVGIMSDGPRAPRQDYGLFAGDEQVGRVVSGGVSPTLETNIGSAYVRLGHDTEGTELALDIRGKRQACTVCSLPFYSRTRKQKST